MLFERLETRQLMAGDLASPFSVNACSAFENSDTEAVVVGNAMGNFAGVQTAKQFARAETKEEIFSETILYGPSVGAPKIQSVVFGDGTAQRSNINVITVQFDSVVDIAPGAFVLERKNGAIWDSLSSELTIQVGTSTINGGTRATLSFAGSAIVGGSLADGNYRLTAIAGSITKSGVQLDGDGNGTAGDNFVRGEASSENFFRRFGDLDGNRLVDNADIATFKLGNGTSLGDANYNANIDFNGDGFVSGFDVGRFRIRNGTPLSF